MLTSRPIVFFFFSLRSAPPSNPLHSPLRADWPRSGRDSSCLAVAVSPAGFLLSSSGRLCVPLKVSSSHVGSLSAAAGGAPQEPPEVLEEPLELQEELVEEPLGAPPATAGRLKPLSV